jgi:hypothetical protein
MEKDDLAITPHSLPRGQVDVLQPVDLDEKDEKNLSYSNDYISPAEEQRAEQYVLMEFSSL